MGRTRQSPPARGLDGTMDAFATQQPGDAESRAGGKPRAPWVCRYLFAGAVGILFVLLNWPGEPDQSSFDFGLSFGPIEIRHGWPLVFAARRRTFPHYQHVESFDELLKLTRLWNVGDALTTFSPVALAADVAIGILAVLVTPWILRRWAATGWPRQFTVRTLLAAMVIVAIAGPYMRVFAPRAEKPGVGRRASRHYGEAGPRCGARLAAPDPGASPLFAPR